MAESVENESELIQQCNFDSSSSLNPKQSQRRSLDDSETLDTKKDEEEQSYIDVSCGALTGRLYLEKMCKQIGSKGKGLEKCIQYGDKMFTPQDFESLGGKKTSKAWKKSIRHKNKPLLRFFASGVFKESESLSQIEPNPTQSQLSDTAGKQDTDSLVAKVTTEHSLPTDFSLVFSEIESNLKQAVEKSIRETMRSLRASFESQFCALTEEVGSLKVRISQLESQVETQSLNAAKPGSTSTLAEESGTNFSNLEAKVDLITETISKQQKLFELNERANRAKNLVIMGLEEVENEDVSNTVSTFLDQKLGLTEMNVSEVKRLGKKMASRRSRPILVSLDSMQCKQQIMQRRSKLVGSKIYLNNDLTKEQQSEERRLRLLRKQLAEVPDFRDKRITIYRGKICVDRCPMDEAEICSILNPNST